MVTVSVSDGKDAHGNTDLSMDDAKGVTISVVDVEEDGNVSLSLLPPQVGEAMTARVMDPDNCTPLDNLGLIPASAVESWVWERSDNADGPWVTIANTTTASYAPVVADKGKYLTSDGHIYRPEGTGEDCERGFGGGGAGHTLCSNLADGCLSPCRQRFGGELVPAFKRWRCPRY